MPNSKRGTESYAAPEVTVGSLQCFSTGNAGIEHRDQGDINPIGVLYDAPFDLQLRIFRGEGTETAVAATLAAVRADVEAGVFWRVQIAWPTVFEGALRLSAVHSRQLGTWTLDLLHVPAACLLEVNEFITSDQRQSDLAEREGLKVVLIL